MSDTHNHCDTHTKESSYKKSLSPTQSQTRSLWHRNLSGQESQNNSFTHTRTHSLPCCNTLQQCVTHCNAYCHTHKVMVGLRVTEKRMHSLPRCNMLQHCVTHCNTHCCTHYVIGPRAPEKLIHELKNRVPHTISTTQTHTRNVTQETIESHGSCVTLDVVRVWLIVRVWLLTAKSHTNYVTQWFKNHTRVTSHGTKIHTRSHCLIQELIWNTEESS